MTQEKIQEFLEKYDSQYESLKNPENIKPMEYNI